QHYGDGVLACFGIDEGPEDAALTGLGCALAMAETVPKEMPGSAARVGLHAGTFLCRVGSAQDGRPQLSGLDLNIAARVEAEAAPGRVMASDRFAAFISRLAQLEIRETRSVRFKGTSTDTTVHEISGFTVARPDLGATRLLERDTLIWEVLNGDEKRLMLVGPAGIGKSALAHALIAQAGVGRATVPLSARSNLTRSPLLPVTEWLKVFLSGTGSIADRLAEKGIALDPALQGALGEVLDPARAALPHPELSLQLRRQNRIEAAVTLMSRLLADPLSLLFFDDFHWCDPDTREVIGRLMQAGPDLAGRVIILSRPTPEVMDYARAEGLAILQVPPLSAKAARRVMLDEVRDAFAPEVEARLIEVAGGNPLFLRALAQAERLQPMGDGKAMPPPTIEATIQHLLGELQTLKETVLTAAVIGRSFRLDHLRLLMDEEHDLEAQAAELIKLGILEAEPQGFAFHHILLRDCAYNILPARRRRLLHSRFASVLQQHSPAEAATYPELVADHYLAAEAMAEAVGPCITAGVKFLGSATFEAASSYLEQAVTILSAVPDPDKTVGDALIQAQTLLGATKVQRFGFAHPEVAKAYDDLDANVTRLNAGSRARMYALYGIFAKTTIGGRMRESADLLATMQRVADPASSEEQILYLTNKTAHLMYSGAFEPALLAAAELKAVYDPALHGQLFYLLGADPLVSVLSAECHINILLGRTEAGQAALAGALDQIDRVGARLQLPWVHVFAAQAYCLTGDRVAFERHLEAGLGFAAAQGHAFWTVIGHLWKSIDAVWQGHIDAGAAGLAQLMPTAEAIGLQLGWPVYASAQARVLAAQGDVEAARNLARAAVERMDKEGEKIWAAWVLQTWDALSART
ncbi:MAG TPA: AAA family ATPase, partial [Tabrizicola sp.]|nr:AAA family ATPase [Tabrizicola sp.]